MLELVEAVATINLHPMIAADRPRGLKRIEIVVALTRNAACNLAIPEQEKSVDRHL